MRKVATGIKLDNHPLTATEQIGRSNFCSVDSSRVLPNALHKRYSIHCLLDLVRVLCGCIFFLYLVSRAL